jgi:FkbM family methyltransferase
MLRFLRQLRNAFLIRTAGEWRQVAGIRIPIDPQAMSERAILGIRRGSYERYEAKLLRALLRPGDRVLELGGGVGFISSLAAQLVHGGRIVTVEANPQLIPVIRKAHALNGASVEIVNAAVTGKARGSSARFFLRKDFWASSMSPEPPDFIGSVEVPVVQIEALVERSKPTVVVVDIEGGEAELIESDWCRGVRAVLLETHPDVLGRDGVEKIRRFLRDRGFALSEPAEAPNMLLAQRHSDAAMPAR